MATTGSNDLANTIGVLNTSALQWYATVTQKPIQSGAPPSLMRGVFGTDLYGGPTVQGQTFSSFGPILVIGIVVLGAVLLFRK